MWQGCITLNQIDSGLASNLSNSSDISVCNYVIENSIYGPFWRTEARKRGLNCGVKGSNKTFVATANNSFLDISDFALLYYACNDVA